METVLNYCVRDKFYVMEIAVLFWEVGSLVNQMCTKNKDDPYVIRDFFTDEPISVFGGSDRKRAEMNALIDERRKHVVQTKQGNVTSPLVYKPYGCL